VHFNELIRSVLGKRSTDSSGISPLQALMVSLASRVGVGNLTGVAVALYLGGAGAIFWMWMVALVGMATAYAEATLAQLYKTRGPGGLYRGGPAFYISQGLGVRWLGSVFSVCLIISFGLVFNAVQANSIAGAIHGAFGCADAGGRRGAGGDHRAGHLWRHPQDRRGGRDRGALHGGQLPAAGALRAGGPTSARFPAILAQIVGEALRLPRGRGGRRRRCRSAAMMNGVKRGLFSNEAGMGSAPNIAAVATPVPHHPSSQGFVQALGPFIDTIVICTATAILILLSGVFAPGSGVTGIALTQQALEVHIGGAGRYFIADGDLLLRLHLDHRQLLVFGECDGPPRHRQPDRADRAAPRRAGDGGLGRVQAVSTVFDAADAAMGLMATINLVAIVLLSGTVVKLTRDYFEQRNAGLEPRFHARDYPEIADEIDHTIWTRD
jgi:AGCS family alanine or glycine:cation symporter